VHPDRHEAPIDVMRSRIAARARGWGPLDADQAVLEWQLAHQEPLDEAEQATPSG
jgi:predicted kinase